MCVTRASSVDDSVALAAAMSAACSFNSFVRAFSMATRTASARCPSATSSCTREAASEVKRARTHDIAASRISLQQIARINQSAEIFVAEHLSGQNFEMQLDAALVDQKGEIQIIPNALAGF